MDGAACLHLDAGLSDGREGAAGKHDREDKAG